MRAIRGGNVPENAFFIIEGGLRPVQKTFKVVIKDLCLHNEIEPGEMVHVYVRKQDEEKALDLGETRVLHDYRIALDLNQDQINQILEGEVIALYIAKLSPDNKPVEIRKTRDEKIEAGQRIVEKQGIIDLKDICKVKGINYRDQVKVFIRKPNEETAIPAGPRRILKRLQIVISDLCPLYKIKEDDVVVVYLQKINSSTLETEEIIIGSENKSIALYIEGDKNILTENSGNNYAESQS